MGEQTVRTASGKVVSNKMDKTIVVLVERRVKHPIYGKFITRSTKLHAHDEVNECNIGDTVTVSESRPLSKTKTWSLKSIDVRAVEV
ncbi:30S ribosomal protein S17 [BD1-7 clade bacterium]|uniref:Small ribosomal subunit protein uS17 n=1 Tax=BD1-7 clade bacterium TaxID=2029982 RepID=A0A5S9N2T4_9GAMM|nr:30S ribosomal protein S17 [BD1-7 clade bacterium]CAA0080357.1 30S ribosomal protein S17 [BD1-7 clade bacterium]CAA0084054.1 30S ribosomal protein S17 [BD1-7 clade bacterium]